MSETTGGNTVWLASYPKSGNTWVRAILTNLETPEQLFRVTQLEAGHQPHHVGAAAAVLGLDGRWLRLPELLPVRHALIEHAATAALGQLLFRKTHEVYRPGRAGAQPFPSAATRAAIA